MLKVPLNMRCKKRIHAVVSALSVLSLLSAVPALAQVEPNYQWSKSVRSLTVFQPGDAVRIQILELYDQQARDLHLSNDYPINPEGYIVMPLIGEVKVKGYTVYEVMQILKEKLSEHLRNPYVYVRPLIRIIVQGAFFKPGAYHVDPAASLWSVVELAGGPQYDCDLKKMNVRRGGEIVIQDVLHEFEKGVSLEEVGIESGDQISGPSRSAITMTFLLTIINVFASVILLYLRLKDRTW